MGNNNLHFKRNEDMTHFQSWIESADILMDRFCQLQARKMARNKLERKVLLKRVESKDKATTMYW